LIPRRCDLRQIGWSRDRLVPYQRFARQAHSSQKTETKSAAVSPITRLRWRRCRARYHCVRARFGERYTRYKVGRKTTSARYARESWCPGYRRSG